MPFIPLTKGYRVRVDQEDFEELSKFRWYASGKPPHVYAARNNTEVNGKRKKPSHIKMHRLIVRAKPGEIVDHVNRNTMDNRRSNLRVVDWSVNSTNSKMRSNKFGVTGLNQRSSGLWVGEVMRNGVRSHKYSWDRSVVEEWLGLRHKT